MKDRRRFTYTNIHESFSDLALLMLASFIFLLVTILITSKVAEEQQLPAVKKELEQTEKKLQLANERNERLLRNIGEMAISTTEEQIHRIMKTAGIDSRDGGHDFDLFVEGLKGLPGKDIHLVIDATGSMHGVSSFLVPVLRVIIIRSKKQLSAITWFSDGHAETYRGSMGEVFDQFMKGAPFVGNRETIGDAFIHAEENAGAPGAYLLIGDEPSDDRIYYLNIPSPVFTLPIGRATPNTLWEYETLAEKTGGKMLQLQFQ